MKGLFAALAGFALAIVAILMTAAAVHTDADEAQPIDSDLWAFACATVHDTCDDLVPPRIMKLNLYGTSGVYGGYEPRKPWTPYLLIDSYVLPQLGRIVYNSVVVHEAVHYIDNARGRLDLSNTCASEARGWAAGNAYVISMGRVDFVDNDWSQRYGCQSTV